MRHIVFSIFLLTLSGYSLTGQNVYDLQAMTDTLQELKKREDLREYSSKQFKILASKIDSIQSSERALNAKLQNDSYNYEREIAILANSFDNAQRELEALRDSLVFMKSVEEGLHVQVSSLMDSISLIHDQYSLIIDSLASEESATVSNQEKLLSSLIGEHYLDEITGDYGANTMFWVSQDVVIGNEWNIHTSWNTSGVRDFAIEPITYQSQKILSAMKIVVTENLSVYFSVDGDIDILYPFNSKDMNCDLAEYGRYIELLDEDADGIDQKQYLYAGNKLDNFDFVKDIYRKDIIGVDWLEFDCIILTCDQNGFSLSSESKAGPINLFFD